MRATRASSRRITESLIVTIGANAAAVLNFMLVARLLSVTQLGSYTLIIAVVTLGTHLGKFGLDRVIVITNLNRQLGGATPIEGDSRSDFDEVAASAVMGLIAGLVGGLAIYLLWSSDMASPAMISAAVIIWIASEVVRTVVTELLKVESNFMMASIMGQFVRVGITTAILAVAWTNSDQVSLLVILGISLTVSTAVTLTTLLMMTKSQKGAGPSSLPSKGSSLANRIRRPLSQGVPFFLSSAAGMIILQGDLLIVKSYFDSVAVAQYAVGLRIASLVAVPLFAMSATVPRMATKAWMDGDNRGLEQRLRTMSALASLAAVGGLVVLIVGGGRLVEMLADLQSRQALHVAIVLSAGLVVSALTGACGEIVGLSGGARVLAIVNWTTFVGIVAICQLLAFLGWLTPTRIAVIFSTGMALQNMALALVARRRTGLWTIAGFSRVMTRFHRTA